MELSNNLPSNKLAYTIAESAEVTSLGKDFIYNLVNTGKIGFVRGGSSGMKKIIPWFEWVKWMKENLEFAEKAK